jgi:hypothetical protein
MSARLLFLLMAFLLCSPVLRAQNDSLSQTGIDTLNKKIDNVARHQAALSARMQFLDSTTVNAIDSSFSRSLDEAKAHPADLYNQKKYGLVSFLAYVLLVLFMFFSFYYLFTTALCRNESYQQDCTMKEIRRRPFSYARMQLWWWMVLILFCYIWFYAVYNVLLPLNPTVVILLGGGLAVTIFGKSIDNSQIERNNKKKPSRHQDLNDSKGFLTDILSDDNGVSMHRLQAVAFNILFGMAFISTFFMRAATKNAYPFIDFEPWQFSLLGISAAGYLGVKANENPGITAGNRQASKGNNQNSDSETEVPAVRRTNIED